MPFLCLTGRLGWTFALKKIPFATRLLRNVIKYPPDAVRRYIHILHRSTPSSYRVAQPLNYKMAPPSGDVTSNNSKTWTGRKWTSQYSTHLLSCHTKVLFWHSPFNDYDMYLFHTCWCNAIEKRQQTGLLFFFLNNNKRMNSTPNSQQDVTSELFVLHSSAGGYSAIVAKARETFLGSTDMNEKSNHDSRVGGMWWRISVVVGHSLPFSWERGRGKPRGRSGVFFFFSFFRLSSFAWAWTHPELVTGLGAGSKHEQRVRVEPSWIGTHADESHSRGQKNVL